MEGAKPARPLVIWRYVDGLRGHENQSDGLIKALAERTSVSVHTVSTPRAQRIRGWWRALWGTDTRRLPNPDLLIGAGNSTQIPMLLARRRRGGHTVVLMKPSFPIGWFDLVIAPAHDRVAQVPNVLITRGAVNRMRPGTEKHPGEGLMLIGGPDREHLWVPQVLEEQITTIASRHPDIGWCAASSRRTPADFLTRLRGLGLDNIDTVAVDDVDADWLPRTLATAAAVWVTCDSVNMLYEALTAGAATGLLDMPRRDYRNAGHYLCSDLLDDGLITSFEDWCSGRALAPPTEPLDEAGRCADWILNEWSARPIG